MKGTEINLQQLPANTSSKSFLKAKQYCFKFKTAEKKHSEHSAKKDEIIEDIGETPKPIRTILSFACIGIALVFAFIEAHNVKATIIGATGMGSFAAVVVGFAFAAAGLVAGEMLSARTSWTIDGFTQRKKPTSKFYIAVLFALVYVCGQYWLASRAGIGTGEEMQETVTTMKWFVLGIAVAELLFGMAFLAISIRVFTLYVANIRIKAAAGKMNTNSRRCEESWQRYIYECDGHAIQEETPAIKDALYFYNSSGFDNQSDENSTTLN